MKTLLAASYALPFLACAASSAQTPVESPAAGPGPIAFRAPTARVADVRAVLARRLSAGGVAHAEVLQREELLVVESAPEERARVEAALAGVGSFAVYVADDETALSLPATRPAWVSVARTAVALGASGEPATLEHYAADGAHEAEFESYLAGLGALPGRRVLLSRRVASETSTALEARTLVVHEPPALTGLDVADAAEVSAPDGRRAVRITLTERGRDALCRVTTEHLRARLAFALDERLVAVPVVLSPICGGTVSLVDGARELPGASATSPDARGWAHAAYERLRGGALAAPLARVRD